MIFKRNSVTSGLLLLLLYSSLCHSSHCKCSNLCHSSHCQCSNRRLNSHYQCSNRCHSLYQFSNPNPLISNINSGLNKLLLHIPPAIRQLTPLTNSSTTSRLLISLPKQPSNQHLRLTLLCQQLSLQDSGTQIIRRLPQLSQLTRRDHPSKTSLTPFLERTEI